jgi:hypothetical protein
MRRAIPFIVIAAVALSVGSVEPVSCAVQAQNSEMVPIIKAIVRDAIARNPPLGPTGNQRTVALSDATLIQCPQRIEAPCITEDVLSAAASEAFKGGWSFELVREMRSVTIVAAKIEKFEYPGLVVIDRTRVDASENSAPLAISRPAVIGETALVYVQFAGICTYLARLSRTDSGWTVSARVLLSFS